MIVKLVVYGLLLALLAGVVLQFPFLWELALAAAIGGVYWIFFRSSSSPD